MGTIYLGETSIMPTDDSGNDGWIIACRAALASSGTINSLSFYIDEYYSSTKMRLAVYADDGSGVNPGALKAKTAEFTINAGTQWWTRNVIIPVVLAPGTYWLSVVYDVDQIVFRKAASGSSHDVVGRTYAYADFPDPWGTHTNDWDTRCSFYGTLSTGAVVPVFYQHRIQQKMS
jgi:hypothetical protein